MGARFARQPVRPMRTLVLRRPHSRKRGEGGQSTIKDKAYRQGRALSCSDTTVDPINMGGEERRTEETEPSQGIKNSCRQTSIIVDASQMKLV
jgi:hypothetical protein